MFFNIINEPQVHVLLLNKHLRIPSIYSKFRTPSAFCTHITHMLLMSGGEQSFTISKESYILRICCKYRVLFSVHQEERHEPVDN